ncbi:hypothetical protein Dimus_003275, partial [Dionaea muscipula]
MDHPVLLLLLASASTSPAHAQSPTSDPTPDSSGEGYPSSSATFQPSLAVIIAVLSIIFAVTFVLLAYAKYCHGRPSAGHSLPTAGVFSSRGADRFSGIDKTVIESLPFFRFSSLRGSKQGLECAVCLSRFEDIEILRLLPKCKHAFHIDCIDEWLDRHSTCPLCRQAVSADDLQEAALIANNYCSSSRFLQSISNSQSNNVDLFVEREEEGESSSSVGGIGSSFRRILRAANKEEEAPIHPQQHEEEEEEGVEEGGSSGVRLGLHKVNHKIVVSGGFVFKNRWSNVSSSDLMFLNSEMMMINAAAAMSRLSTRNLEPAGMIFEQQSIAADMERKRMVEQKVSELLMKEGTGARGDPDLDAVARKMDSPGEKRSMSEINMHSRFFKGKRGREGGVSSEEEEKGRRIWFPIARRTVE